MENQSAFNFSTPNELHLWLLPIREVSAAAFSEGYDLLAPDERARNQRYFFEKDRVRHLLTRVFIRQLLGAYLKEDPASLQFQSNHYGRPSLVWPGGQAAFDFNISHAGHLIACGLVPQGHIGIDIEPVDRDVQVKLARTFFARKEIEELFALPEERRSEHFLRLWTLKEAYIKAQGMGMSISLDAFAFYGFEQGHFQLWDRQQTLSDGKRWSMFSLQPVLECMVAGAWFHAHSLEGDITIKMRKFLPAERNQITSLHPVIAYNLRK